MQADSIVPINTTNLDYLKHIQLSLIVDYHETNLLYQLNRMNREDLVNDPKTIGNQQNNNKKNNLKPVNSSSLLNENKNVNSDDEITSRISFNEIENIGRIQTKGQQKENETREFATGTIIATQINSIGLDRFAYVSNCPTSYTDPTGHRGECKIGVLIVGVIVLVWGGLIGASGLAIASTSLPLISIEGLGGLAVGGTIAFTGLSIVILGGYIIYRSDCIPGLSS